MPDPTILAAILAPGGVFTVALEMLRRQHSTLREVRHQVANSHSTNLRDDVDRLTTLVRDGQQSQDSALTAIRADIAGVRADLRDERAERMSLANRVTALETAK